MKDINESSINNEILFLTSYPGLDKLAIECLEEVNSDYSIKVTKYKSLYIPDEEILKDIDKDCKVIITRGYPATICKKLTNKHVIEVEVTFQDVINAINKVITPKSKDIAIIAYANILNEENKIIKLGDINLHFLTLNHREKDKEKIKSYLKNNNINAVVGSALVYETTLSSNVKFHMIQSSKDSIIKAIKGAILFIDNEKILREKKKMQMKSNVENGWIANYTFRNILGKSKEIQDIKSLARRYAKSDRNILITGGTGTGKELFAQSIHNESNRFNEPFISINCGEISENLIESELFGYEKGAYTGAKKHGDKGLIMAANGGTLFLDEISEASLSLQTKLLRVFEEKKIRRVGSNTLENVDIRFICATNKNLKDLSFNNLFKKDLYYRLSELELNILSLKKRKEDIYYLAKYFTEKEYYNEYRRNLSIDEKIFKVLLKHDWNGNIRELKSFVFKMVYFCNGKEIDEEMVQEFFSRTYNYKVKDKIDYIKVPLINNKKQIEAEIYSSILKHYNGDRQKLCEEYDISRSTLWRKLNRK